MPAAAVRTREMSTKMKESLTKMRPITISRGPRDAAAARFAGHDLNVRGEGVKLGFYVRPVFPQAKVNLKIFLLAYLHYYILKRPTLYQRIGPFLCHYAVEIGHLCAVKS
jgi:hypothetical protein